MRVLVVGDFLKSSGMTRYIFNVIGNIQYDDLQIDVLAVSGSDECKSDVEAKGWHFFKIAPANGHLRAHWAQARVFFKWHAADYDVIHFNESALWNFLPILYAHRYGARKIVLDSHNTYFASNGSKLILAILNVLHAIGKRLVARISDCNLAVSQESAKWLFTKSTITKNQFLIVPNAINLANFDFNPDIRMKTRQDLGLNKTQHLYGNVGILNHRKNQLRLLDIFGDILISEPDAKLVLIGDGPDSELIKNRMQELNMDSSVMMLGKKNNVRDYYQAMDAIVMPSTHEGLSTVLIEAQVSGLKIFTSSETPLGDYLNDLVYPISLADTNDQWSKIIVANTTGTRSSHLEQMIQHGFDQKTAAQQTLQVYLEALSRD